MSEPLLRNQQLYYNVLQGYLATRMVKAAARWKQHLCSDLNHRSNHVQSRIYNLYLHILLSRFLSRWCSITTCSCHICQQRRGGSSCNGSIHISCSLCSRSRSSLTGRLPLDFVRWHWCSLSDSGWLRCCDTCCCDCGLVRLTSRFTIRVKIKIKINDFRHTLKSLIMDNCIRWTPRVSPCLSLLLVVDSQYNRHLTKDGHIVLAIQVSIIDAEAFLLQVSFSFYKQSFH